MDTHFFAFRRDCTEMLVTRGTLTPFCQHQSGVTSVWVLPVVLNYPGFICTAFVRSIHYLYRVYSLFTHFTSDCLFHNGCLCWLNVYLKVLVCKPVIWNNTLANACSDPCSMIKLARKLSLRSKRGKKLLNVIQRLKLVKNRQFGSVFLFRWAKINMKFW